MSVADWLRRAFQPRPPAWTDDMSVRVRPPRTLEELVDFVLDAEARKVPSGDTTTEVMTQFGLTEEDARLAWDRALGGVVRAATSIEANRPDPEKDPVAWISYQRCLREPSLIEAIRPQSVRPKTGAPEQSR